MADTETQIHAAEVAARADVIHTSIEGAAMAALHALQWCQAMRDLRKSGGDVAVQALAPQVSKKAREIDAHMCTLEEAMLPGDENREPVVA